MEPSAAETHLDVGALREVIRQGERMLAVQERAYESAFQRTADLLRLAVAALGGVIVVAGILAASGVRVDTPTLAGFAVGVSCLLASVAVLAFLLAGAVGSAPLAYGPDFGRMVGHVGHMMTPESGLLASLALGFAPWLELNEASLRSIKRRRSFALLLMGVGVVVIFIVLVYIAAGAIHE